MIYAWEGFRSLGQTREVVAAESLAEISRLSGLSLDYLLRYGTITVEPRETEVASANPGVIFWRRRDDPDDWKRSR